jgi:hypothetical protein
MLFRPASFGVLRALALLAGSGCAAAPAQPIASASVASPAPASSPAASALVPATRAAAPAPVAAVTGGEPCGALDCRRFDNPAAALQYLLGNEPVAIGFGEAHAPAGSELPSTAARFTEQLLPVLAPRTSHLIVELLQANAACPSAARPLEQAQKPVTAAQSPRNQSDYVNLGVQAKARGIEPFVLTPSCEEFQAIADAGEDAILRTLSTIASVTQRVAKGALVQNHEAGRAAIVIAYGGALHNDLAPSATQESFRYGDALHRFTGGRYLALDLIVREFIRDNAAWRALPWYAEFDPARFPESSVLLRTAPQSYVLFFPRSFSPRNGVENSPAQ